MLIFFFFFVLPHFLVYFLHISLHNLCISFWAFLRICLHMLRIFLHKYATHKCKKKKLNFKRRCSRQSFSRWWQVKQYFAYETQHQHGAFAMTGGFKHFFIFIPIWGKIPILKPTKPGWWLELNNPSSKDLERIYWMGHHRISQGFSTWMCRFGGVENSAFLLDKTAVVYQTTSEITFMIWSVVWIRSTPHPVTVTTRIITYLVGNPYKPSFATVTGWGVDPRYELWKNYHSNLLFDFFCDTILVYISPPFIFLQAPSTSLGRLKTPMALLRHATSEVTSPQLLRFLEAFSPHLKDHPRTWIRG